MDRASMKFYRHCGNIVIHIESGRHEINMTEEFYRLTSKMLISTVIFRKNGRRMKDTLRIDDCYVLPRQSFYLLALRCFLIRNVRVCIRWPPFLTFSLDIFYHRIRSRYLSASSCIILSSWKQFREQFCVCSIKG